MDHTPIPPPTTVIISSKGQFVIPKEFRFASGLEAGSRVALICHEDGSLELRPIKHSIAKLMGVAKTLISKTSPKTKPEDESIMLQVLQEDEVTKTKNKD